MSEEVRNGLMKQRRKAREKNKELQQENKQLKSVLNEVREKVKEIQLHYQQYPTMIPSKKFNDLQEILDKVGDK